jgi:uncharacterized protein YjaG (DUF416 family)
VEDNRFSLWRDHRKRFPSNLEMTEAHLMYNREEIARVLSELEPTRRLALCAICAERQMPLYDRYWVTQGKEHSFSRTAMDRVWDHLFGNSVHVDVEKLWLDAKAKIPDEDDLLPGYLYAQDAAIAVTYVLETWLHGDVQSVVFCLEQAYNVVDNYVTNQVIPNGIIAEQSESTIQRYAVVQAELARHRRKGLAFSLNQMRADAGQTRIVPNV